MKKKLLYVVIGLILVLIVTNPGVNTLKLHYPNSENIAIRENFFVCTIFDSDAVIGQSGQTEHFVYLGILGNFFVLDHR